MVSPFRYAALIICISAIMTFAIQSYGAADANPNPSPTAGGSDASPSPTPAPYLKKLGLSLEAGPFLNDPFTASYLVGLTANYKFSEKSGLQLSLWNAQSRNADTITFFENTTFQEPDHNGPVGFYGVNYTWTPITSSIAAKLGFLGNKDIPFEMTFAPGLGATLLQSSEITAPPTYIPPAATTQFAPTVDLDINQTFHIFNRWTLRVDFMNYLYNQSVYSSQTGAQGVSHITYNNAILIGFGYSCTLRPHKPKKKQENQVDGAPEPAPEPEEDTPPPPGVFWCW